MGDVIKKVNLGTGKQKIAYLAEHENKEVVVYQLRDENSKIQFDREERFIANMKHDNILRYLGSLNDLSGYVVEYCSRGDLHTYLYSKESYFLTRPQAFTFAIDLCEAVRYLHRDVSPTIFHGDIKPHNLFISGDWYLKLGDFGLSITQRKSSTLSTVSGSLAFGRGTCAYMAPELLDNKRSGKISWRTDIYSMGCVLLEIFGGGQPWNRKDPDYIVKHVVDDHLPPELGLARKKLGKKLYDIIHECMKEPRPDAKTVKDKLIKLSKADLADKTRAAIFDGNVVEAKIDNLESKVDDLSVDIGIQSERSQFYAIRNQSRSLHNDWHPIEPEQKPKLELRRVSDAQPNKLDQKRLAPFQKPTIEVKSRPSSPSSSSPLSPLSPSSPLSPPSTSSPSESSTPSPSNMMKNEGT